MKCFICVCWSFELLFFWTSSLLHVDLLCSISFLKRSLFLNGCRKDIQVFCGREGSFFARCGRANEGLKSFHPVWLFGVDKLHPPRDGFLAGFEH